MNIEFEWIGYKSTVPQHRHVWGVIKYHYLASGNYPNYDYYIFYGECNHASVKLERMPSLFGTGDRIDKIERKEKNGYRRITEKEILLRWPDVMKDIEMQFVIKKLANA